MRRNESKSSTLNRTFPNHVQPQQIYDSIGTTKPSTPLQYHASADSAALQNTNHTSSTVAHRPEYLSFERNTLDYRLKNSAVNMADLQNSLTDCRSLNRTGTATHNGTNSSSSSKSIDDYHQHRYSGSDFMANNIDFSLTNSNQLSSLLPTGRGTCSTTLTTATLTNNNKNSRQSRNHIITDTLPGPESCV